MNKSLKLSPSALNLFGDCPHCFWMDRILKFSRPRGIFPSLPGGMDRVIKSYFDGHRLENTMPPELVGKVPGKLFEDLAKLERWRSWRTCNLTYVDPKSGGVVSGALDDLLIDDSGIFYPFDYKTRGSELKSDPRQYYGVQLDTYALMLDKSGYPTGTDAYLCYYWPIKAEDNGIVVFQVEPVLIKLDKESTIEVIAKAFETLTLPEAPESSASCEYCNYLKGAK